MTAAPGASPTRRRPRVVVAVIVAMVAAVYIIGVSLYAFTESNFSRDGCQADPQGDAILISFSPEGMDAAADRLVADLRVEDLGPADGGGGSPSSTITVVVLNNDGPTTFEFPEGTIPVPVTLRLITDGDVEQWPFDTHSVNVGIVSLQGTGDDIRPVPTELCGTTHVPGWSFAGTSIPGTDQLVINGERVDQVRITASRSPATVTFGIVILALMMVLPVLALTVATLAFIGARKVEATLTSWMAAMLFATVPLRTFLPGSPPIGSWVDFLVVIWVVAGLVAALALYVAAWIRWAPAGGRSPT